LHHGVVNTFGSVLATSGTYISALRNTLARRNRHGHFEKPI
jgi:hypothetical protein